MSKKLVLVRGPLLSQSGYGQHCRDIFRWLLTQDVDLIAQVVPWGMTSWYLDVNALGGLIGEIMKRAVGNLDRKPDVSFQIQLPDEWDPSLATINVGVSAFVETDVCAPNWVDACNRMHHVVVPSQHVKETICRSGQLTSPISVVPESFMPQTASEEIQLDLSLDTSFNFLVVAQLTSSAPEADRKNIYNTIKWLCEVFKNDPEVGIITKINSGTSTTIDRAATQQSLSRVVSDIKHGPFPKVHLIHGMLTEPEVMSLYRRSDVKALVSLTRGEGFGLPLLEAAACDLPVIATQWSGHLDFLQLGKFVSVNYKLVEIPPSRVDSRIFIRGSKWAEPTESDFKRKIRKFRESPDVPRAWAKELGVKIRARFTQESINQLYTSQLKYLL